MNLEMRSILDKQIEEKKLKDQTEITNNLKYKELIDKKTELYQKEKTEKELSNKMRVISYKDSLDKQSNDKLLNKNMFMSETEKEINKDIFEKIKI